MEISSSTPYNSPQLLQPIGLHKKQNDDGTCLLVSDSLQDSQTSTLESLTVSEKFYCFSRFWNSDSKLYEGIQFYPEIFRKQLEKFNKKIPLQADYETSFGFIEKKDIISTDKIFVRADLHGDLKSLLENLRILKDQGYLDQNFKCKKGIHLVFMGDYVDRGKNSCQVLELLAALKIENPEQVFLIRGNHEYLDINFSYGGNDHDWWSFLFDENNHAPLLGFYQRMPLTLYIGQEGDTKEYVQFTHGLFELSVDPAPLLDTKEKIMQITKFGTTSFLSKRVQALADLNDDSPVCRAAKRIQELATNEMRDSSESVLTAYNWGDVSPELNWWDNSLASSRLGSLGNRRWALTPEDIKYYLMISSDLNNVRLVFRGHEHKFQHHEYKGDLVVTTLPVGMDSCYKERFPGQSDRSYILTPASKVNDWGKQAFLRSGGEDMTTLSGPKPIQSTDI